MKLDYSAFENELGQLETCLGYLDSEMAHRDPGLRKVPRGHHSWLQLQL